MKHTKVFRFLRNDEKTAYEKESTNLMPNEALPNVAWLPMTIIEVKNEEERNKVDKDFGNALVDRSPQSFLKKKNDFVSEGIVARQ